MRIFVLNPPDGHPSALAPWDIENHLKARFARVTFEFYQSHDPRVIIDAFRAATAAGADGVLLSGALCASPNPVVRDALAGLRMPVLMVHAENVRGDAALEAACTGVIAGLGLAGYELAVRSIEEDRGQGKR